MNARVVALLLAVAAGAAPAARGRAAEPPPDAVVRSVLAMRQSFPDAGETVEDTWRPIAHRGRPSLEITGRTAAAGGSTALRDVAIADLASGRIASFVWFPAASRRGAGEPIMPMSEAAAAADGLARALFPGVTLDLDGIQRYLARGEDGVYYEVGYTPEGAVRFVGPVVRLVLDASTGALYRVDVDAGWFDPLPPPERRISAKAAQRIAGVRLAPPALEPAFGPGAQATRLRAEGVYFVRPNAWPSPGGQAADEPGRYAWGVAFAVAGAAARGEGTLFVDLATGRPLGGAPGPPP